MLWLVKPVDHPRLLVRVSFEFLLVFSDIILKRDKRHLQYNSQVQPWQRVKSCCVQTLKGQTTKALEGRTTGMLSKDCPEDLLAGAGSTAFMVAAKT